MAYTFLSDFCCKVFMYKKRTLAVLFLVLEALSFALDQYGGRHLGFLVASVFVSLVGFLITVYNFSKSRSEVVNERNVIELVFSIVQLVVTYVYFISATLGVKLKLNSSVFPLVLAITAAALAFKNNEQDFTDSSAIQIELISSNTSSVVVEEEITDSLASHIQGVPTVVDEEEIVDSSSLLLHVTSSNALAVVESTPRSLVVTDDEENTDSRTPLISSNTPTMSDDEEITSPTMSDDEEIMTTPRGYYDVDEGTYWNDFDEGTRWPDVDEGTSSISILLKASFLDALSLDMEPERFLIRPHMTSAQSNLWQSTKLFSKYVTISDLEGELPVPSQAMKHFSIPELGEECVDLAVKDLKEKIWNFRLTTHPRLALTDGWHEFVGVKELIPGDIVTFYKLKDEIFGEQYRVEVDSEYKL